MKSIFAQALEKAKGTPEFRMAIRKVHSFATEKPEANLWHFALLFDDGDVVNYRAENSKDPDTVKSGQAIVICKEKQGEPINVGAADYIDLIIKRAFETVGPDEK